MCAPVVQMHGQGRQRLLQFILRGRW